MVHVCSESNPHGRDTKATYEFTGPSPTTHPLFKLLSPDVPANLCTQMGKASPVDTLPLRLRLVHAPLRFMDSFKAALSILRAVALGAQSQGPMSGRRAGAPEGRVSLFELQQTRANRADHSLHVPSQRGTGSALAVRSVAPR